MWSSGKSKENFIPIYFSTHVKGFSLLKQVDMYGVSDISHWRDVFWKNFKTEGKHHENMNMCGVTARIIERCMFPSNWICYINMFVKYCGFVLSVVIWGKCILEKVFLCSFLIWKPRNSLIKRCLCIKLRLKQAIGVIQSSIYEWVTIQDGGEVWFNTSANF